MYEIFPHTADVGLRVQAPDLNTLFADAGRGFFSLIVSNLDDVAPQTCVKFDIQGTDPPYLLVDWLNELLFTFESQKLILSKFSVTVGPQGLQAEAYGERVDEGRHMLEHEIKAVTHHGLRLEQTNRQWLAEVILDI